KPRWPGSRAVAQARSTPDSCDGFAWKATTPAAVAVALLAPFVVGERPPQSFHPSSSFPSARRRLDCAGGATPTKFCRAQAPAAIPLAELEDAPPQATKPIRFAAAIVP